MTKVATILYKFAACNLNFLTLFFDIQTLKFSFSNHNLSVFLLKCMNLESLLERLSLLSLSKGLYPCLFLGNIWFYFVYFSIQISYLFGLYSGGFCKILLQRNLLTNDYPVVPKSFIKSPSFPL